MFGSEKNVVFDQLYEVSNETESNVGTHFGKDERTSGKRHASAVRKSSGTSSARSHTTTGIGGECLRKSSRERESGNKR